MLMNILIMPPVRLLLMSILLTGCAGSNLTPIDYEPIYAPAISGTLRNGDQTMPAVELVLAPVTSPAANCYFEKKSTVTDREGNFGFEPLLSAEAGDLAKETEYRWQICIKDASGMQAIWYDSKIGRLSPNAVTRLACDVSKPRKNAFGVGLLCKVIEP